jgi:hypothetical protein
VTAAAVLVVLTVGLLATARQILAVAAAVLVQIILAEVALADWVLLSLNGDSNNGLFCRT